MIHNISIRHFNDNILGGQDFYLDDFRLISDVSERSCANGAIEYLYSALYDFYQICDYIQNGDIIKFNGGTMNVYGNYNDEFGSFYIPAVSFKADGVHIVRNFEE